MKNILLVWNIVLTLLAGYLFFQHVGQKKQGSVAGKTVQKDSVANPTAFRMAYFEMDSIENNFQMVKDVKAEINKREQHINIELENLSKNIQQRYNYFQGKAQAGNLTESDKEAASQELKYLDDQMKNRKQVLDQEYNEFYTRKMKELKSSIEDFLKEYNRTHNFSYIVSYEQGLFYYKDTAYNITSDVIKGLNELYRKNKKG